MRFFNKEQKTRYIEYGGVADKDLLKKYFMLLSSYECEVDKDAADMKEDELIKAMETGEALSSLSLKEKMQLLNMVSSYSIWASKYRGEMEDDFIEETKDPIFFNDSQKKQYLQYNSEDKRSLMDCFTRFIKFENFSGRDIAEMSRNQLVNAISSLELVRITTREQILELLKGYVKWAISIGKAIEEHPIFSITLADLNYVDSSCTSMLKNPQHLTSILDAVMPPRYYAEMQNRCNRDSLVFWLLYSGLDLNDIQKLKKDDLDIKRKVIRTREREFTLYDSAVILWRRVAQMTFMEKTGATLFSEFGFYDLIDNDLLFRPIVGNGQDKSPGLTKNVLKGIVQNTFTVYRNLGYTAKVSPRNIILSGIFYRLLTLEKTGVQITPSLVSQYINGTTHYTDSQSGQLRRIKVQYRKWLQDFKH